MSDWKLSGFGDEIDADPRVQIAVLQALGASYIEVRSAWDVNVADFTDEHVAKLKAVLAEMNMGVSAVASPIGKVDVDEPVSHEVDRLMRVAQIAKELDTKYIRIFSFFHEGRSPESVRDAVIERMRALADVAEREGVILVHENEKGIYGDVPDRVLDIFESVDSPALRMAWDNANFVQVGVEKPFDEGFAKLRPYFEYLQLKDSVAATKAVVPVGEGDGQLHETLAELARDGYVGFASLEPHLTEGHELGGFSGPHAFGRAARALRELIRDIDVELV